MRSQGFDSQRERSSVTQLEQIPLCNTPIAATRSSLVPCKGKAPPVSEITGEDPDCNLDDWLPSLGRVATWNTWTEEEQITQFTGHLKGRASTLLDE